MEELPMLDVLIQNAEIVDGTNTPSYSGDIAIKGDKIADIGSLAGAAAKTVIDGNLKTAGEATIISEAKRLSERAATEVLVSLPQTKSLSKIVLVSNQLNQSGFEGECQLLMSKQGEWKLVKTFIVEGITTDIHFPVVQTNQIRFRLPGRTKFAEMRQTTAGLQPDFTEKIITTQYYDAVAPLIQEIEIYGPH
jgi:hypothetical protein